MSVNKETLDKLRNSEFIYVIMSDYTKMPYVVCDEKTYDDEIFLYFIEEDAKREAEKLKEERLHSHVLKVENRFLLSFYTSLFPMGVNCMVVNHGLDGEEAVQLSGLVQRENRQEEEGKQFVENPELHLTALYMIQKLRSRENEEITEELRELQEELMAHYEKGKYIIALQEGAESIPVLRQKDGQVIQPIFTDIQEFMKLQSMHKEANYRPRVTEVDEIPKILSPEITSMALNPFGVNLRLQVNR